MPRSDTNTLANKMRAQADEIQARLVNLEQERDEALAKAERAEAEGIHAGFAIACRFIAVDHEMESVALDCIRAHGYTLEVLRDGAEDSDLEWIETYEARQAALRGGDDE